MSQENADALAAYVALCEAERDKAADASEKAYWDMSALLAPATAEFAERYWQLPGDVLFNIMLNVAASMVMEVVENIAPEDAVIDFDHAGEEFVRACRFKHDSKEPIAAMVFDKRH